MRFNKIFSCKLWYPPALHLHRYVVLSSSFSMVHLKYQRFINEMHYEKNLVISTSDHDNPKNISLLTSQNVLISKKHNHLHSPTIFIVSICTLCTKTLPIMAHYSFSKERKQDSGCKIHLSTHPIVFSTYHTYMYSFIVSVFCQLFDLCRQQVPSNSPVKCKVHTRIHNPLSFLMTDFPFNYYVQIYNNS